MPKRGWQRIAVMMGIALLAAPATLHAQTIPGALPESAKGLEQGEWPAYGGTYAAARYSPLTQINRDNAKNLHVAWRWKSPDMAIKQAKPEIGPSFVNESTPLMRRPARPNGCSIQRSMRTASALPPISAGRIAASPIGAMATTSASASSPAL